MTQQAVGTLYGIGVGPGDPELITVKGRRILEAVPVVFLPVSSERETSIAGTIASYLRCPDYYEIVSLPYPMTRDPERLAQAWRANAGCIAETLRRGRDAAFLTEGDALLYSTFIPTMAALRDAHPDIPVVVVPGVTSIAAAAAATLTPIAQGGERVAILPAINEDGDLAETLRTFDTVVLMKAGSALDRIVDALEETGRVADAVFVERCGWTQERVVRDITMVRGEKADYFSLVIVRGVAS